MKKSARSICNRKIWFVTAGLALALLGSHAYAQDITPLEPGKPITRTAKARDAHTYSVPLTAGQFIRVLVEQNTVDVSVDLIAPDNKPVHLVNNSRFWGTESLSWEAATSGTYKLIVRALSSPQSQGSYQIQLGIKDTATTPDKQRIAAEQVMSELTRIGPRALPMEQKLEKHKEALRLWQALGDKQQEANAHEVMGMSYGSERKYELARECYQQALAIKRELQDYLGSIVTLSNLGLSARAESSASPNRMSEKSQQLIKQDEEYHHQALAISREVKHRGAERYTLNHLLSTYNLQNLREKSHEALEQMLAIDRESKNHADEAETLQRLALSFSVRRLHEEAIRSAEQAVAISQESKNRAGEAFSFSTLGVMHSTARHDKLALQNYETALAIFQELKDRRMEGTTLRSIGFSYNTIFDYEKAAAAFEKAAVIFRELKDQINLNATLPPLTLATGHIGSYEKAQQYFEEHLKSVQEAKDRRGEALALTRFAANNSAWNRNDKAIEYYNLAIPIYRELNDSANEGVAYREIANTYGRRGHYEKTLEFEEKALALFRKAKHEFYEAQELNNLAYTYTRLNQNEKALQYAEEGLLLARKIKSPLIEAAALITTGDVRLNLREYTNAAEHYEQALKMFADQRLTRQRADALWGLAIVSSNLGQPEKALSYFEESLTILRRAKARFEEALVLTEYATALRTQGQNESALQNDLLALQIARELKARDSEALALAGLRQDWMLRNQPQLAIFFGKQAVNTYQEMRSGIRSLDQDTQRSFLKAKEQTYRDLADLLISQGRLPEAEQVIRMLKEEEYFEYVRRDQNNSPKGEKAALTPEEAAIEKRYREIADQLTILGSERGELLGKPSRTAAEESRLAKLEADLTVAGRAFQTFLDGLSAEFAKKTEGQTRVIQVREAQGLMEDLRELGKGTVALYTLVGENKFRVILTTPDVQKAYEVAIKGADLNRKVLALREVLQNPRLDPRPAAQELYQILFAPLAKDLEQMKAKTLMWSLDGVLRYVPVAALYDGKQYLVERFQHTIFTPVSKARLKDEPSRNWKALGLGVTKSFGPNIPALPAVADEMRGIIKDETNGNGGKGILPGTIKLDDQFTFEAMKTGLRARPPVVHVASHFRFKPGDETDSALLLGDGNFLSLAEIKALPNPFGGVELLTLSACNTATGGSNANGKEVEGFGVLAQDKGAKAVVASLWPVADRTTQLLMEEFYRGREARKLTKGEALRQSQIKLLRGELMKPLNEAMASRDIVHEITASAAAKYPVDAKRPHAHPYYWAPFILIGNWK